MMPFSLKIIKHIYTIVTNWPNFPLQDDALSAVSIVEGSLRAQQKALMEKYRQDKEAEQVLKDQEGKKKEKEKEKEKQAGSSSQAEAKVKA